MAQVTASAGKPAEAVVWFRKAIAGSKAADDALGESKSLCNLAGLLLYHFPQRLDDARQLALEALAIQQTLDPAAAEVWLTYNNLAGIAEQQGESAQATDYRRQAREARMGFMGTRHELRRDGWLIEAAVETIAHPEHRVELEETLTQMEQQGWTNLVAAIRRMLDGERNEEVLCEPLNLGDAIIVMAILQGLEDPASLRDLLPDQAVESENPTDADPLATLAEQDRQIALMASLNLLQPEADELRDLPAQLRETGFTALASVLEQMQAGEEDLQKLTAELDDQARAIFPAILWLLEDPERLQTVQQDS